LQRAQFETGGPAGFWADEGPVTNSLVQSRFGMSRSQALTLLRGMAHDGLLAKVGAGRATSYQLTD